MNKNTEYSSRSLHVAVDFYGHLHILHKRESISSTGFSKGEDSTWNTTNSIVLCDFLFNFCLLSWVHHTCAFRRNVTM